jgi:hypothetical protein
MNLGGPPPPNPSWGGRTPMPGDGGRTPSFGGMQSRTPAYRGDGGRTPAWNPTSRTPAWTGSSGSKTPAWGSSGSKTPAWGNTGSKTPAWGNSGSKTPAWGGNRDGGRTPAHREDTARTPGVHAWDGPAKVATPGVWNAPTPGVYASIFFSNFRHMQQRHQHILLRISLRVTIVPRHPVLNQPRHRDIQGRITRAHLVTLPALQAMPQQVHSPPNIITSCFMYRFIA